MVVISFFKSVFWLSIVVMFEIIELIDDVEVVILESIVARYPSREVILFWSIVFQFSK